MLIFYSYVEKGEIVKEVQKYLEIQEENQK